MTPERLEELRNKTGLSCDEACEVLEYIVDLEEVLGSKRQSARLLDVALNGEDRAARQASLCDLIGDAKALRARVAELEEENALLKMQHDADAAAIGQMARKALKS